MNPVKMLLSVLMICLVASISFTCKKKTPVKTGIISEPEGLRIRSGPTVTSNKMGLIPFQSRVVILDDNGPEETLYNVTGKWMKIQYEGKTGWVFGGFIKKEYSDTPVEKKDDDQYAVEEIPPSDDSIMSIGNYDIMQNENAIQASLGELLGLYKGKTGLSIVIAPLPEDESIAKKTRQLYSIIVKIVMGDGRFKVLERDSIEHLLKEKGLKQAGIVDDAKMGKISGANLILSTKYSGGVLEFKIVKTATAEVLSFSSVTLQ